MLDAAWPGATTVEGATTADGGQAVVHVEGRPEVLPVLDAGVVVGAAVTVVWRAWAVHFTVLNLA